MAEPYQEIEPEEGGPCLHAFCDGRLEYQPVEGCTCFQCAPCSACLENKLRCPDCGEEYRG